ncbi:hypothetical protein [Falsiroseomonas sp. HW251]|uniref:hypothetical protein n=1 Tax=Falsiroseomonas sp. HW251 TaxID=3390998 RepID=UPI003D320CDC
MTLPRYSAFETSVAGALRALGHNVALQVGVAGYRIDLAVRHPEETERFVLGIECDGATYHRASAGSWLGCGRRTGSAIQ